MSSNKKDWLKELNDSITRLNVNLVSDLPNLVTSNTRIDTICKGCNNSRSSTLKDFIKLGFCRKCNVTKQIVSKNPNVLEIKQLNNNVTVTFPKEHENKINFNAIDCLVKDEKWMFYEGYLISDKSRCISQLGQYLTLDERVRWHFLGLQEYACILIAKAFKIKDYEKLSGKFGSFVVRYKDSNRNNIDLDNLYISARCDIEKNVNLLPETIERHDIVNKIKYDDHIKLYKYIYNVQFPDLMFFEDGNICKISSRKFFIFSTSKNDDKSKTYYKLNLADETSYYVHRLICFVYHPIKDMIWLSDYKDFQVNHKDGNTHNNAASNLEWVTKSENMKHAYVSGLNKKVQGIKQHVKNVDGTVGELIKEHISIAQASRETGVPEYEIRAVAQGKTRGKHGFLWVYSDPEKAKEYSKKFSKHIPAKT